MRLTRGRMFTWWEVWPWLVITCVAFNMWAGLRLNGTTRFLATQQLQGITSCTRLKNSGAHTDQHDCRCPLYAGAILADFLDIIAVTSSLWRPTETIVCGHPGLPAIMQQCILYLAASQRACDVTLSRESSNDCFWLVNTANDGRVALPVCSDTATPVATSRQILNRSNVLRRNCDWPKSSCKVAQTGQLDGRVASQVVVSLCLSPALAQFLISMVYMACYTSRWCDMIGSGFLDSEHEHHPPPLTCRTHQRTCSWRRRHAAGRRLPLGTVSLLRLGHIWRAG